MSDNARERLAWRQPALRWASLAWLCAGPLHPAALAVAAYVAITNLDWLNWDNVVFNYRLAAYPTSVTAAVALLSCIGPNPPRARLITAFAAMVAIPALLVFFAPLFLPEMQQSGEPLSLAGSFGWGGIAAVAWLIASTAASAISYPIIRRVAFRSPASSTTAPPGAPAN